MTESCSCWCALCRTDHPPFPPRPPRLLLLQVRPSKTSKAFWEAMSKVQGHLTDAKSIIAYNQKKEQKMKVRARAVRPWQRRSRRKGRPSLGCAVHS